MAYSVTHEAMYADMIDEMLQHAGFRDGVRAQLVDLVGKHPTEHDKSVIDDLYQIYADDGVIDD